MESDTFQSVSQLTESIKYALNADFADVWVTGEISGLTKPRSGHIYFTLKDSSAQISTVIWRSSVARLQFQPQEGMQILCRGYIDVYPQRGNYQLIARVLQPVGEGTLQQAFRKLHHKLRSEGLFDERHKKDLPQIPRRVVVITSPTGAAIHDFLQVATRRWPHMEILIVPVPVQGPEAAAKIARALKKFGTLSNKFRPDVIVVTRGGGSIEDLWAFNEEIVVRAIFDSKTPVISAVGHEIDVSLSDLVADMRALTPSEAAEKLVPNKIEVLDFLNASRTRLSNSIQTSLQQSRTELQAITMRRIVRQPLDLTQQLGVRLDFLESRLVENSKRRSELTRQKLESFLQRMNSSIRSIVPRIENQLKNLSQANVIQSPLSRLSDQKQKLDTIHEKLQLAMARIVSNRKNELEISVNKLEAFNPKNVLQRGFSLTTDDQGNAINDCNSLSIGDTIQTWLAAGKLTSNLTEIQSDAEYLKNGEKEIPPKSR